MGAEADRTECVGPDMGRSSRLKRARTTAPTKAQPRGDKRDEPAPPRWRDLLLSSPTVWIWPTLLAATGILYLPVLQYPFVNSDDPVYVTSNAHVLAGLSWSNVWWAPGSSA